MGVPHQVTQYYLYDSLNRLGIVAEGAAGPPANEDACGSVPWCRDFGYDRYGNRAVINAEMFPPREAVEAGFLDRVVEPDAFDAALAAQVAAMQALNREAFRKTKRKARKSLLGKLEWAIKQDADDFASLLDALSQSN